MWGNTRCEEYARTSDICRAHLVLPAEALEGLEELGIVIDVVGISDLVKFLPQQQDRRQRSAPAKDEAVACVHVRA